MKKTLLLFILLFVALGHSYAQWGPSNLLTFDPTDTFWKHAIHIDTAHYTHNLWQVGKPHKTVFDSAYSYPNALVTDTLHPYPANDTSVFYMTFPGNTFVGHDDFWIESIGFYYKLDIDTASFARIEFSPDSGLTWINLKDSIPHGINDSVTLSILPGWHFASIDFRDFTYYHDDSIIFRFSFISGADSLGNDGWMIDDMHVLYAFESVANVQVGDAINIYPNPANDAYVISCKGTLYDKANVSIFDVAGRLMHSLPLTGQNTSISIADLQPGTYLCRIDADGKSVVSKRLVVMR